MGFAAWSFVTHEEAQSEKPETVEETPREKSDEEILRDNEAIWGPGANFQFCANAFFPADEEMLKSCGGKDYCSMILLKSTKE